jgi:hypothetical protein
MSVGVYDKVALGFSLFCLMLRFVPDRATHLNKPKALVARDCYYVAIAANVRANKMAR